MKCPDSWLKIILSMSVRLTLELIDPVKQTAFPNVGGPHLIC